jgi:Ricin-type beta-trefoil lectin domain-like
MKNIPGIIKLFTLLIAFLFIADGIKAQQPTLPKDINRPKQILPVKPNQVIKKDSVKYVAVPVTVTANTTIATADQLYLGQGSFAIRTYRDYRYLTYLNPAIPDGRVAVIWEYINNPVQQFWNFVLQPGGFYKIKSESGLYLMSTKTVGGGYVTAIRAGENTDNFLWQLEDAGEGYYYIKSKAGVYLELNVPRITDGSLIVMVDNADRGANKKWHLIKMTNDRRKITSISPERDGFRFINTFNGEDFIRWGGLCGGMVYTVLDYFRNSIPVPTQSYTPANATALQSYIYQRQQHSMSNVNEKWSELEVSYNTRAGEIFRWGIQGYGGGRLEELKNAIDAGKSVPIGLFVGGVSSINGGGGGNHVMLAIGYALGRYTGDFTGHPSDFKILAYDPNMGNRTITIVPNMAGQCFFEVESGKVWRTYFVNNRYDNEHTPPRDIPNFPEGEPEGSIRHLYFTILTGGDDLRGNSDNVGIKVNYTDGTSQNFPNVNGLVRWVDNSIQTVHLELNRPVRKSDITHFTLTTTFGDGYDSDDWNLDGYKVTNGAGGIVFAERWAPAGSYLFRFSGDQHLQRYAIPVSR